jgi:transposase
MFARKLLNRSGSISVQIINKDHGRYQVVQTVGTAKDPDAIERFWQKAQQTVRRPDNRQGKLFVTQTGDDQTIENAMEALSNASVRTIGPELIFGTLFDRLGFNQIKDQLFRYLVIARLAWPLSKLKTCDYLYRYNGTVMKIDAVYKFLDRLHSRYKAQSEAIAYVHTKKRLKNITVVFYDITTLYFEAEAEDDLRKVGFSKDGKFQHPQIMLGLLVGELGLPIGYDIFKGNTFEGHTLLPTIGHMQKKYGFKQPIVVADAAMLSRDNLTQLQEAGYQFIIGARIKSESQAIKQQILEQASGMQDGGSFTLKRKDGTRLVVTYSDKRAAKDNHNRKRGIARLQKRIKTGRLTKSSINSRGYNKFLTLDGNVTINLNEDKIKEDTQWDGLKGYITTTRLGARRVTENYSHLWQIEKAFRISKTDLRVRPIYHYRQRRIEAHICIAFVAYAIYKELELLLKKKGIIMSAKRAGELTHNMYELHYTLPDSNEERRRVLGMDDEQQLLHDAVHRS